MKIIIFGGRGHVGSSLSSILAKKHTVYTFDRSKSSKNHIKGDLLNEEDVKKALKGKDVVINLVGLSPVKKNKISFSSVHVQGVKNILVNMTNKQKLIQISALGADYKSEVEYLRTKGKAEQLIIGSKHKYTILRPSFIFSKKNEFFKTLNKTALMVFFPKIPTRMQPVYLNDLIQIIHDSLNDYNNKIIEICGKEIYTTYELAKIYRQKKKQPILPVPYLLFKSGFYLGYLFGFVTKSQYLILNEDNVAKKNSDKKLIYTKTSYKNWNLR